MKSIRTFTVLAMLAAAVPAWAQSTAAQAPATPSAWSQNMDKQMQSMQEIRNNCSPHARRKSAASSWPSR